MQESDNWYAMVITVAYCCLLTVRRLKVHACSKESAISLVTDSLAADENADLSRLVEVKKITTIINR